MLPPADWGTTIATTLPAKETGAEVGVTFDVGLGDGDGVDVDFDAGDEVTVGVGVTSKLLILTHILTKLTRLVRI